MAPAALSFSDRGVITEGTLPLSGNRTITFHDANGDGLLDGGDQFLIGGLAIRGFASLNVDCGIKGTGRIRWNPGHGYVALPLPPADLRETSGPPYRIDVRVAYPHPNLAFAANVTVTLQEATAPQYVFVTLVDGAPLRNGTLGTFGTNGSLTFDDADGDGAFSSGDYFDLRGTSPTADYLLLTVSVLYGSFSYSRGILGL